MIRNLTSFLLFVLLVSTTSFGQVVDITLKSLGVSPRDVAVSTTDIYTKSATGLNNVGVGTVVYIKASISRQKFGNPTLSVSFKPLGSTVAVGKTVDTKNDSTQVFTFIPDKPGVYELKLTDGPYSGTLKINAAKFLGYTNTVVNGKDTKLNCTTCHNSYVTGWEGTGHATTFTRALNGELSDHFGSNCVSCHTLGYNTDSTAVNDGMDDFGFTLPKQLKPGTVDSLLAANPNAMLRSNVQCESCHGPASGHLGVTTESRMESSYNADVCASCHDSGTHHVFPEQFAASYHSGATSYPTGPGRESCVECHTGKGFVQYVKGIPTNDPYFDPNYTPITCAACHDPHSAENTHQLRKLSTTLLAPNKTTISIDESMAGTGALCFNCHKSRTEAYAAIAGAGTSAINTRFGPHHGPQGDIIMSNNLLELGTHKLATSNHIGAASEACVTCHMYSGNAVTNGKVNKWGGHSFSMSELLLDENGNVVRDAAGRPTHLNDNMEACAQCHGNTFGTSFEDVKFFMNGTGDFDGDGVTHGLQHEVEGMIEKILEKLPHNANGTLNGPNKDWTKEQLSAYWNALAIEEDKSMGIHNPKYIVTALLGAMETLGIVTAVETEEVVPTNYTLFQNYPNPFNPTTNIRFALPKASNVKIIVYDAIGKEVATIVNNSLTAGTHTITWNARNLASGIYLCRIEADDFVKVNKMLLLK